MAQKPNSTQKSINSITKSDVNITHSSAKNSEVATLTIKKVSYKIMKTSIPTMLMMKLMVKVTMRSSLIA